jgi:hypothetical protein
MVTHMITGQCLCGACAYRPLGPLAPGGICHCKDCRRVTGSAFGVSFRADRRALTRYGVTGTFAKRADSGTCLTRHFCTQCGSPMYTESEADPEAVFIKAGTLDNPDALVIDRQMWRASKVPWADVSAAHELYDRGR